MTTMLEDQPIQLESALENNVLLLSTSIGWWRGMYKLSRSEITVLHDQENIGEGQITTPQAKLMTNAFPLDLSGEPWCKRFQAIENVVQQLKDQYTVRFPIDGVRIIPKSRALLFMEKIFGDTVGSMRKAYKRYADSGEYTKAQQVEYRLNQADYYVEGTQDASVPIFNPDAEQQSVAYRLYSSAKEFCDQYDDILTQMRQHSDVFDLVANRIPDRDSMLRKFYVSVVPIEIAGATSTNKLTMDILEDHQAIIEETCRKRVEEAIEQIIREPREALAKAIADLQTKVANNTRLSSNSFNEVRRAIQKIRLFDFAANEQLLKQINKLESSLNDTPPSSVVTDAMVNQGFSAALGAYYMEVVDASRIADDIEQFGRGRRKITL